MFRKSLFLACTAALALGATARADSLTTNVTLQNSLLPGGPQSGVIELDAPRSQNQSVSYTVNTNHASPATGQVFAVGMSEITTFSQNPPGSGGITAVTTHNLVVTFALHGNAVPPNTSTNPGATLAAKFDTGAIVIYDTGGTLPNSANPASWTSATPALTASIKIPENVGQGLNPLGAAAGVTAAADQNLAAFGIGGQTLGTLLAKIIKDNSQLVPPNPFDGLQGKFSEINAGGTNSDGSAANTAAFRTALDTAFAKIAGDAGVNLGTTTPFTTNAFDPSSGLGTNGDTIQQIGIDIFPIQSLPPGTSIPEPASMLLWGGIAAAIGIYRSRRARSKKA